MADDGRELLAGIESELTVKDRLDIAESELRRDLARTIMRWFVRVNVAVLLLLAVVYGAEALFVWGKLISPSERIIGQNVLLAVIAGTTAQLGAIALSISKWLFPQR